LCSNFVKFGRREIGKIVPCSPGKKKQNFVWLSSSRYCADHTQNLPGPAQTMYSRVLQISSKSVHFWRSYIRTREHHQSALESESNIQLQPRFEPNNKKPQQLTTFFAWWLMHELGNDLNMTFYVKHYTCGTACIARTFSETMEQFLPNILHSHRDSLRTL